MSECNSTAPGSSEVESFHHGSSFGGHPNPFWYLYKKFHSDHALLAAAIRPDCTVLNIGCSFPFDELVFAHLVHNWTATDFTQAMVDYAQGVFDTYRDRIPAGIVHFETANPMALHYPDDSFDVVTCFSTLEHYPTDKDRETAVSEMARVARQYVIVTVQDMHADYYMQFVHSQEFQRIYGSATAERPYSKGELAALLERHGLRIREFAQFDRRFGFATMPHDAYNVEFAEQDIEFNFRGSIDAQVLGRR